MLPFCEEIRRTVMTAPRMKMSEIRSAMYKAAATGRITEAEAEDFNTFINARRQFRP